MTAVVVDRLEDLLRDIALVEPVEALVAQQLQRALGRAFSNSPSLSGTPFGSKVARVPG